MEALSIISWHWFIGGSIAVIGIVAMTVGMIVSDRNARTVALALILFVGGILLLAKFTGGE